MGFSSAVITVSPACRYAPSTAAGCVCVNVKGGAAWEGILFGNEMRNMERVKGLGEGERERERGE